MVRLFVSGHPRPAGSKTGIPIYRGKRGSADRKFTGKVAMLDSSGQAGKEWRQDIKHAAKQVFRGPPLSGPLVVNFSFVYPRPKNHFGTGKNSGLLKDGSPKHHTSRPDVLKLSRAVEDALTGIVWVDDSQIVDERISKSYGDRPGVHIIVASL